MDDLIASLECVIGEDGAPDAACQEAVALLRKQAARVRELEAETALCREALLQWQTLLGLAAHGLAKVSPEAGAAILKAEAGLVAAFVNLDRAALRPRAQEGGR